MAKQNHKINNTN